MTKIAVVGSSNTDMILRVRRIPAQGETVIGGAFSTAAGGKGANQAVAAARAGGSVSFVACVGGDSFGDATLKNLKAEGIDLRHVCSDSTRPSGVAFIFVDETGENSIGVASGANDHLGKENVAAAAEVIVGADMLLLQLETPYDAVEAAVELAHRNRVRTVLNPAPARPLPATLLSKVSVLTPNETEAEMLTGFKVDSDASICNAADMLHEKGVPTVVITLGARGAFCSDLSTGVREVIAGFSVDATDSTAAGDVFNGTLAVALAEGAALPAAVTFANAAAAISVTRAGAQPSIPLREEIEAFLSARASDGARRWFSDAGKQHDTAPAR